MITPWHINNSIIKFPYHALHDRVFIYPLPPKEKFGKESIIEIPKTFRQFYASDFGIILSIGSGYYSKDNKWHETSPQLKPGVKVVFNKNVPWRTSVKGLDGKNYSVIICGAQDIWLVDEVEVLY